MAVTPLSFHTMVLVCYSSSWSLKSAWCGCIHVTVQMPETAVL